MGKWIFTFEILETEFGPEHEYHDDYFDEEVKIKDFPFRDVFGDFRIFNGLALEKMDNLVVELSGLMKRIDMIKNE